jgi:small subunit ribosomal protein S4
MIDAKCKKCRVAGEKLFLKKERCYSPKCAIVKKPYRPGVHGKARKSASEYGSLLAEKQKVKNTYFLRERQFKKYFTEASRRRGNTGEILLQKLELRLDNAVFRAGLASSRSLARQLVGHGHFLVNGRRVDIPSYEVKKGDVVEIRPSGQAKFPFSELKAALNKYQTPSWIDLDKEKLKAKILRRPQADDIGANFKMDLIVEYYSR